MKRALLLLGLIMIVLQSVRAQKVRLKAKIVIIDTLIKSRGIHISNMLSFFELQLRDSLHVFRLDNGVYKISGVRSGRKAVGLRGISGIS